MDLHLFFYFLFLYFFFVMATPPLVPSCRFIFSHTEGTICAYAEGGGGSSNLKKRGKERGIRWSTTPSILHRFLATRSPVASIVGFARARQRSWQIRNWTMRGRGLEKNGEWKGSYLIHGLQYESPACLPYPPRGIGPELQDFCSDWVRGRREASDEGSLGIYSIICANPSHFKAIRSDWCCQWHYPRRGRGGKTSLGLTCDVM